ARPLTDADADALKHLGTTIDKVVPIIRRTTYVAAGTNAFRTTIYATTPGYVQLTNWAVDQGGMFTDEDVAGGARVCVLGASTARSVFGDADPLGQTVRIDTFVCRVVGVLAAKGNSVGGDDLDGLLLLPTTAWVAWFGNPEGYTFILTGPRRADLMDA